MDLTKVLLQSLGNNGLDQISRQVGLDQNQTSSAMSAIVPTLLAAMAKNTSNNSQGASGLLAALDRDHDGSILDDLGGFLGNSQSANGAGILKHILGGSRSQVESGLANKVGADSASMGKLLEIAAPLIMAYLGRQKKTAASSGFDAGGLGDLLGNLAGGSRQSSGVDIGDLMDMFGGLSGATSGASSSRGGGLLGTLVKGFFRK